MNKSFIEKIRDKVELSQKLNLKRELETTQRISPTEVFIRDKIYTSFSCNDYFGLVLDKDVIEASTIATTQFGSGASSSRLISGNHPLYNNLEKKLAAHYNKESAIIFSSGYTANIGALSSLAGKNDLIIADKLVHACLLDGAKLSGAKFLRFEHNNYNHCALLLSEYRHQYENCFVVIESIYSMTGNAAPLNALNELCLQNDTILYIDNAHGFGIVDLSETHGIISGSLSKGLGSVGGYICAEKIIVEYLVSHSRNFMFTTALPASAIAAASKSYDLYPPKAKKLMNNAMLFCKLMDMEEPKSHIISFIMENVEFALNTSECLKKHGFLIKAIRPPTVPKPLLRVVLSAEHSHCQIERLCHIMKNSLPVMQ